jgi:hypothetical protein
MLPTMQFEMILGSIGSATLSTNTGSFGVSHLLERNTEVSVERVIGITRHDLLEEQHGKGTTPSPSGGIGDFLQHHAAFVLALCFRFEQSSLCFGNSGLYFYLNKVLNKAFLRFNFYLILTWRSLLWFFFFFFFFWAPC